MEHIFDRIENISRKGENAGNPNLSSTVSNCILFGICKCFLIRTSLKSISSWYLKKLAGALLDPLGFSVG